MRDHRNIDERSLAFGGLIAERLRTNPEHVKLARENLHRWMTTCSAGAKPPLQEWLDALNGPIDGVIELLTSRTERAIRLRQSNPFAGLLSISERNAIIRRFYDNEQKTA